MLDLDNIAAIFNAVPAPCLVLLPDTPRFTIVAVNKAYCTATNTIESELIDRGAFEAFPDNPHDAEATGEKNLKLSYEQVITTKAAHQMAVQQYDIPIRGTSEFKLRYWALINSPVLNEMGEVQYIIHSVSDVTDQVLAEEKEKTTSHELVKNQEHYRSLFDHHPDAIFSFDLEGNFLSANQGSAKLAECSVEDILRITFAPLIAPEDAERVNDHFLKAVTGEIQRYNTGFITSRGNRRIISVTNLPIIINNEIIGVYGIAKDITQEVQADLKLKYSQEQFRKIMDYSLDIICIADVHGNFVKMSKASETIWGYRPEELEGKPLIYLIHDEDKQRSLKVADGIINGTDIQSFLNRYKRKDGNVVTMSWSAYWDRNEELLYCVGRDVTEIIAATEKIKHNEKRFRTLIQNSYDGIALISADGTVLERSLSAMRILGLKYQGRGNKWLEILHPDDRTLGMRALSDVKSKPDQFKTIECRMAASDKWVEFTLHNQLNEHAVKAIVVNSRDITATKKASQTLKASKERYQNLFYNNPLPMWIYDSETFGFLEVNQAAMEKYGYSEMEFLKMKVTDIRPAEDIAILKAMTGTQTNYGTRYKGYWRHYKKNGDLLYVDITSQNVDHESRIARLVLANDVTEKVKAEEAIRANEQRFKALVQEGSDLISVLDENRQYKYLSPAYTTMLGINPEELIGHKALNRIHKEDRERVSQTSELLTTDKRVKYLPFRYLDGYGQYRWLESVATNRLDDPSVRGFIFNSKDVTDRIDYIQAIEEQNKKLREIAWNQSHLVRAPLSRIMGLANVITLYNHQETNTKELLNAIVTSANELDVVIRDIVHSTQQ